MIAKKDMLPEEDFLNPETLEEEPPAPRRDYSHRVDRLMQAPAQRTQDFYDWKQILLGLLFVAIAIFFIQTSISSTFGWIGTVVYAVSGTLVALGAVRSFVLGFRKK